jgi:hypothetical protein|tara:strand:+ start:234 stop:479 length:246 start_codon:yes stop_codon:yes gene_type:complete
MKHYTYNSTQQKVMVNRYNAQVRKKRKINTDNLWAIFSDHLASDLEQYGKSGVEIRSWDAKRGITTTVDFYEHDFCVEEKL